MKLILVCVILPLIFVSAYGQFCQQKSYHLMTLTPTNWFKAFAQCRSFDMTLASVSSKEENDRIVQLIESEGHSDKRFWTSGTKLGNDGAYYWMGTGKSLGFTNWASGQPDKYDWGTNEPEACIEFMSKNWDSKWNDARCSAENYHFICEKTHLSYLSPIHFNIETNIDSMSRANQSKVIQREKSNTTF
ncbi:perlucin-like [Sitodiplosis mosellana]|uniref:perlucin-like n=1 Tax=Sitodiplosis mosellana TaxID=263140 RepID=UPI002443D1CB|nr:perlucin-like [Sitodiplosis mosellana]